MADSDRRRVDAVFRKRDLNRDGKLSLIEVRLWLGASVNWASLDLDGNGDLSPPEVLRAIVEEDAKAGPGSGLPGR